MHPPRGEPGLSNFKTPALTSQNILQRHPDVVEDHLGMPQGGIVITERGQGPDNLDARRIFGHQYLALL